MNANAEGDTQRSGRPGPSGLLRVASFDVRTWLGRDGWNSWPLRAAACAAAIRGLDADLVGLQEVRPVQERSLARRLPGYAGAGAGRDDGYGRGERCTVVYRAPAAPGRGGRCTGSRTRRARPARAPGATRSPASSRSAASRTGATGGRFGVADAHWDGASAASRRRSAEALLGWLDPSLPWIVSGDLNATAGDPAVARLVAGGLRDTLAHLGERGPQAATHHPWDGVDRRHAHRLRARRRRTGTCSARASTTRAPADGCRPTTGPWSPRSS